MAHSEIRYFPTFVVVPRLFFERGFYDLISGFYVLFPELVPYGLLSEIRPGPYMETNGVLTLSFQALNTTISYAPPNSGNMVDEEQRD